MLGIAEGIVGETIGLIAAFRLADLLTSLDTRTDAFIWLALAVAGIPLVIGTSLPVFRHGRIGAVGVAAGWALAFVTLSFIALTSRDAHLAEGTAFTLVILVALILPTELLGIGVGVWLRRRTHS